MPAAWPWLDDCRRFRISVVDAENSGKFGPELPFCDGNMVDCGDHAGGAAGALVVECGVEVEFGAALAVLAVRLAASKVESGGFPESIAQDESLR